MPNGEDPDSLLPLGQQRFLHVERKGTMAVATSRM